ncbi:MAG: hypothetical protein H7323_05635 [Frankiales bacterium]|nr:hypothetical protein [Frankiales bacterium]
MPDPAGGTFDAAGDFDRLLVDSPVVRLPVWSSIDPHGVVDLSADGAERLLVELATVILTAEPGAEQNGLRRLSALCQECARHPALTLRFIGD